MRVPVALIVEKVVPFDSLTSRITILILWWSFLLRSVVVHFSMHCSPRKAKCSHGARTLLVNLVLDCVKMK